MSKIRFLNTIFLIFLGACNLKIDNVKIEIEKPIVLQCKYSSMSEFYKKTYFIIIRDGKINMLEEPRDLKFSELKYKMSEHLISIEWKSLSEHFNDGRYSLHKFDINRYTGDYSETGTLHIPNHAEEKLERQSGICDVSLEKKF